MVNQVHDDVERAQTDSRENKLTGFPCYDYVVKTFSKKNMHTSFQPCFNELYKLITDYPSDV